MTKFEILLNSVQEIEDPRIDRTKKHKLSDIIVLSIYGLLCGAEGFDDIEFIARARFDEIKQYVELENGVPHHDTMRRVFERINPKSLIKALTTWINSLEISLKSKVVAIDGKTLRGSFDTAAKQSALHCISAFFIENSLVLGQCFMDKKGSEITKIPELLETIDVQDAIITIDAIACQKEIVKMIVEKKKANFVIGLKANQPSLHKDMQELCKFAEKDNESNILTDVYQTLDKGHGRIETRSCLCIDVSDFIKKNYPEWKYINTIARVTALVDKNGKHTSEQRYYISSLPCNAKEILSSVRQHWGIENSLHWVLDVVFKEDASRIRKDHSPANFATLRRFAYGLVKNHKPKELTNKRARLGALLTNTFADQLFTGIKTL